MTGRSAVRRAATNPWSERLARLGLGARGVLFIVLGILTFRVALGHFSTNASQQGALQQLASQPGGKILVWIVAIGLVGYALWRLLTAALGPVVDPVATDGKQRVKALAEGIGYGVVAVLALKVATGSGSSSSSGSGQKPASTVLSWPGGQFLVGLVGLLIIGIGVFFVVDGVRADFTKELKITTKPVARKAVIALGRFGRISQGVVFGIIGVLVMIAAVQYDPNKAKGLDGALKTLAGQPYGKWVLGIIALGFIAYGVYGLAEAKLRRLN